MKAVTFAVPGDLDTPTGGYVYDRRVVDGLRALGWQVDVIDLGEGFPDPGEPARCAAIETLTKDAGAGPLVVDGLALGVLPEVSAALDGKRRVIALVHHPLALETGLTAERAAALRAAERAALSRVPQVIVTSANTARLIAADYGVPESRIAVAPPGNDRMPRANGSYGGAVKLLAVGSVVPRKGYDVLLAALAPLGPLQWFLEIVGDFKRDPATTELLVEQIEGLGLKGRVRLSGALPSVLLTERYQNADLFVLPSRFEGYGMAFSEALAHGLPVIGTTAGAIPTTVPAGAGVLVPPNDVQALLEALNVAITDADQRRRWADAAWASAQSLPTWESTAQSFAAALEAPV